MAHQTASFGVGSVAHVEYSRHVMAVANVVDDGAESAPVLGIAKGRSPVNAVTNVIDTGLLSNQRAGDHN